MGKKWALDHFQKMGALKKKNGQVPIFFQKKNGAHLPHWPNPKPISNYSIDARSN